MESLPLRTTNTAVPSHTQIALGIYWSIYHGTIPISKILDAPLHDTHPLNVMGCRFGAVQTLAVPRVCTSVVPLCWEELYASPEHSSLSTDISN